MHVSGHGIDMYDVHILWTTKRKYNIAAPVAPI